MRFKATSLEWTRNNSFLVKLLIRMRKKWVKTNVYEILFHQTSSKSLNLVKKYHFCSFLEDFYANSTIFDIF